MALVQTKELDCIILDLVMPHLEGLGVLERLNAQTTIKRPKIIILTAFVELKLNELGLSFRLEEQ